VFKTFFICGLKLGAVVLVSKREHTHVYIYMDFFIGGLKLGAAIFKLLIVALAQR
jgi:hypothetical protein